MTTVNLPDSFVETAKIAAQVANRSVPKQIVHWAKLGKVAEENPDLPLEFIRDILESIAETNAGIEPTEFEFGKR